MANTSKIETKKSFIMYHDYEQHIAILTPEQRGHLLSAIFKYANDGVIDDDLEIAVKVLMSVIAAQMDRDNEKYQEEINQRSNAGKKSAQKRKQKKEAAAQQNSTQDDTVTQPTTFDKKTSTDLTVVNFVEQKTENIVNSSTKSTDNDNVNVNVNVNDNDNDNVNVNVNGDLSEEESDTYTVKDKDISSAKALSTDTEVASLSLPLRDGKELPVTRQDIERYESNFPNVPVEDELYAIKRWLSESSSRKRSSVDTMRLVHNWLSKRESVNSSLKAVDNKKRKDDAQSDFMKNLDSYLAEHPDEGRWLTDD